MPTARDLLPAILKQAATPDVVLAETFSSPPVICTDQGWRPTAGNANAPGRPPLGLSLGLRHPASALPCRRSACHTPSRPAGDSAVWAEGTTAGRCQSRR